MSTVAMRFVVILGLVAALGEGRRMDMKGKLMVTNTRKMIQDRTAAAQQTEAGSASGTTAELEDGASTAFNPTNKAPILSSVAPSDLGFMLVMAALVQLMTPGLAAFYGGLVRDHNTLTMITQNFVAMGVVSVMWIVFLFSLCFGRSLDPFGIIGNPFDFFMFRNMPVSKPLEMGESLGVSAQIPGLLYALYQCMFAVITPCLMTGAYADRLRFKAWLAFLAAWEVLVYAPWCHMIWSGGILAQLGVADFAGGIVVHTTAGFSCLAVVLVLGKRGVLPGRHHEELETPHSVPLVFLGTALLWFGWFGFNAGSALGATSVAVVAGWNTQVAGGMAMLVWSATDWIFKGKPGLVGKCVGAIAGLATITPAAGFIQPEMALVLGAVAAVVCYGCVILTKFMGFDDALDVWGVHGMGGFTGSVLLGVLADGSACAIAKDAPDWCVNPGTVNRSFEQLALQIFAAVTCAVYSFVVSYGLIWLIGLVTPLSYTLEESHKADQVEHGEQAYTSQVEKKAKLGSTTVLTLRVPAPEEVQ